jgi:hypothetical protein
MMANKFKPWDKRERKHWRKVEKRQKRGKFLRAPLPEINDATEEIRSIDPREATAY